MFDKVIPSQSPETLLRLWTWFKELLRDSLWVPELRHAATQLEGLATQAASLSGSGLRPELSRTQVRECYTFIRSTGMRDLGGCLFPDVAKWLETYGSGY